MLTFALVMKISIKKTEGKKCDLCRFSATLKIEIPAAVEIQMPIFCKNR